MVHDRVQNMHNMFINCTRQLENVTAVLHNITSQLAPSCPSQPAATCPPAAPPTQPEPLWQVGLRPACNSCLHTACCPEVAPSPAVSVLHSSVFKHMPAVLAAS